MYYIGIDLGGTKILGAIVNTKFEIIDKKMVLTSREKSWEGVGDDIVSLVKEIVDESNLKLSDIKGTFRHPKFVANMTFSLFLSNVRVFLSTSRQSKNPSNEVHSRHLSHILFIFIAKIFDISLVS